MSSKWQEKLYVSGYLFTSDKEVCKKDIGLEWNSWKTEQFGKYILYVHPKQNFYSFRRNGLIFILVGHAYNPFTMESDENQIIEHLSSLYGTAGYQDYLDMITGLFFYLVIENDRLILNTDCSGLLPAYYCHINGELFISAYSQLIADLCNLTEDEYVSNLKKSRFFRLYGWYLPGDMSPYRGIRRVVPNTEITYSSARFSCRRIYPRNQYAIDENGYETNIKKIGKILHNNMRLINQKWKNPAISLTGGMDSQTTLACTGDIQDRFNYFSYVSLPREETDANAAKYICNKKGLKHTIYHIELDKSKLSDFDEVAALVERHYSYLGKGNENDICKRISLSKQLHCDIEVKSWVSEVVRASRYKMYGRKKMPRLTARRLTTMYKVFTVNRLTAVETDKRFKNYLEFTGLKDALEKYHYPWSEFFVWEIVFGCWGSLALTGEQKLTNDITVPFNNRAVLDMMLRTPLDKRISDQLNRDIIKHMDKELYDLNIHIINGNETKLREIGEKMYFELHSLIPW